MIGAVWRRRGHDHRDLEPRCGKIDDVDDVDILSAAEVARVGDLHAFTDGWLANRRLSEHTRDAYRRDVGSWLHWCQQRDLDPLKATFVHVNAYARALESTVDERSGKPLVVAMLDLDHFKTLNDRFGHSAGDAVLREWSDLLKSKFRGSDIVCRYGGEEFVIILPEITLDNAQQRLEQLRIELQRMAVRQDGQSITSVTVSIGMALYPVHGRTNQGLLQAADQALYRAKELGRNCVVIASDQMAQDVSASDWSLRIS